MTNRAPWVSGAALGVALLALMTTALAQTSDAPAGVAARVGNDTISTAELEQMPGFWRDIEKSRAEARRLLQEAGHPNLKLRLVNRTIDQPFIPAGIYAVDQWKKIGVVAEHAPLEQVADGTLRRGQIRADNRTLPSRQAVRLDDARGARLVELLGGRHTGRAQDLLGEGLRALDARRLRARPEDGDAGGPQLVGESGDEWGLGADDDEVDAEAAAESDEGVRVGCTEAVARAQLGDARVSGRRVELAEKWTLRDLPRERVLPPAAADDEDVHAASLIGRPGVRARRGESARVVTLSARCVTHRCARES